MRPSLKLRAFSLVELSIVLVILGLLVGGVLSGQALIRAAELRSVNAEYQKYTTSILSFRDKYFGLPGDLTNATQFWGTDSGGCNAYYLNSTPKAATCNGNGDGQMDTNKFTCDERWRAWQQLADAGLIEGMFTGTDAIAAASCSPSWVGVPGQNVPASKISNAFWYIYYALATSGDPNHFDHPAGNLMSFSMPNTMPLTPAETWNLDTKFDDGKPAYGRMQSYRSTAPWGPGCTTTDVSTTSQYAVTNSSKVCKFFNFVGI